MRKLRILNRKIVKQGESHFVYIPKAYFDNGQLNVNEMYEILIYPQNRPENKNQKEKVLT